MNVHELISQTIVEKIMNYVRYLQRLIYIMRWSLSFAL